MEKGSSSNPNPRNSYESNKYSYKNNYMGKNPMTRTQRRRFQREKKLAQQNVQNNAKGKYKKQFVEVAKRPAKERLLPPMAHNQGDKDVEDQYMDDDLHDS
ncbi:hypothetical protein A2U01_0051392, partial [Trifolium medium]|nr:hypothetical protein [Trifolium medium]